MGLSSVPSYNPWGRLKWPAMGLLAAALYGIAAYMFVERWSFIDSLYMTVGTLTTVGLEEARPLDSSGELITVSLMVSGVSLVVITLSLVALAIAEGGLGEMGRRRRMHRRIGVLKDHYIVCAYGRVGRTVARELEAEGVEFVVIDKLEELEDQMIADGVHYLIGDPTQESALRAVGIERARGLVCAVDDDADNVYITLAARAINPKLLICARASEPTAAERMYRAGADRVVSPYVTSGRHMALQVLRPRVLDYFEVGERDGGGFRVDEIEVKQGSDLVSRSIAEVCATAICLAVRRGSGEMLANPDPELKLAAGDVVVVLGEKEALRLVEQEPRRP
jgi:voltage-gated potassium channel